MMTATNADLHGPKTHQFLQYTNLEIMRITMDHANSLTYHNQAPQGCLRARIRTAHFDVCDLGDTRKCGVFFVELPSRLKEVENIYMRHTVDGSEIRLTSWYGSFFPLFNFICRIWYIPGGCLGFLNHQQYVGEHFGNKFWIWRFRDFFTCKEYLRGSSKCCLTGWNSFQTKTFWNGSRRHDFCWHICNINSDNFRK